MKKIAWIILEPYYAWRLRVIDREAFKIVTERERSTGRKRDALQTALIHNGLAQSRVVDRYNRHMPFDFPDEKV